MQAKNMLHCVNSDAIAVLYVAHDKGPNGDKNKLEILSVMI